MTLTIATVWVFGLITGAIVGSVGMLFYLAMPADSGDSSNG